MQLFQLSFSKSILHSERKQQQAMGMPTFNIFSCLGSLILLPKICKL
jgi:lipid-A-disaccharide synthase-like uncharacterized protein